MTTTIISSGRVMGGHLMTQSLEPRVHEGTPLSLYFDPTDRYPERITIIAPDGQYAGHLDEPLARAIHEYGPRVVRMSAICRETSSRRKEGWAVEVLFTLLPE